MGVEKLQEYIDSVAELEKSYSKVLKYKDIVGTVSRYLTTQPYKMTISNVQVGFVATEEREYTLNGDEWPTAKQLAETLSDYINKRNMTRQLFTSLSEAQRNSVKPPPDI